MVWWGAKIAIDGPKCPWERLASAHSISYSNGGFSEPLKVVFDHICILGGIMTEQKMYEIITKKADEMKALIPGTKEVIIAVSG